MGAAFRVTKQRGVPLAHPSGARIVATIHPSAILRAPDSETRSVEMARFIADLRVARSLLAAEATAHP